MKSNLVALGINEQGEMSDLGANLGLRDDHLSTSFLDPGQRVTQILSAVQIDETPFIVRLISVPGYNRAPDTVFRWKESHLGPHDGLEVHLDLQDFLVVFTLIAAPDLQRSPDQCLLVAAHLALNVDTERDVP